MPWIPFVPEDALSPADRVPDTDHILQVHGVHPRVMRLHYDLYVELMRGPGPLSRAQREMLAVAVSATNGCQY
jgi:alkylhydroperoxidase family enzyme